MLFKAIGKHANFFTQACRRSWLSVRLGQHGNIFPSFSIIVQLIDEFLHEGNVDFMQGILEHQGERGIVNILRGEAEVNKFLVGLKVAQTIQLLLDIVLHGFYVVVGYALDFLDAGCALFIKSLVDSPQLRKQGIVEIRQLRQRELAQRYEILDLHFDAVFHQSVLGKVGCQRTGLVAIATVKR